MPCCAALGCSNHSRNGFRLFRFPADPYRHAVWLQMTKRDNWTPTKHSRLCEAHFEENQYELHRQDGKKLLKYNAIPTLFTVPSKLKRTRVSKPSLQLTSMIQQSLKMERLEDEECSNINDEMFDASYLILEPMEKGRVGNAVMENKMEEDFSQVHFEVSKYELHTQDGNKLFKCTDIQTCFSVLNKPKRSQVRINRRPLQPTSLTASDIVQQSFKMEKLEDEAYKTINDETCEASFLKSEFMGKGSVDNPVMENKIDEEFIQVHFEESQNELYTQDGKKLLKCTSIPTLSSVPNQRKRTQVRNPSLQLTLLTDSNMTQQSFKTERLEDEIHKNISDETCEALFLTSESMEKVRTDNAVMENKMDEEFIQVHSEESQYESQTQDSEKLLNCTTIATLSSVSGKPKISQLRKPLLQLTSLTDSDMTRQSFKTERLDNEAYDNINVETCEASCLTLEPTEKGKLGSPVTENKMDEDFILGITWSYSYG